MPGRREQPTKDELASRIEFVRRLLARCQTISTIKRRVRKRYGDLDARTIGSYIARAREQIHADAGRGRDVLRAESLAYYEAMIGDPAVAAKDQIRAAERRDKLMGLEDKTEPTGLEILLGLLPPELAGRLREAVGRAISGGGSPEGGETGSAPVVPPVGG